MDVSDQEFGDVVDWPEERTVAVANRGFRVRADEGMPIKICARRSWNCWFLIETVFSLLERVFHAKKVMHRIARGIDMRLGFLAAC